MRHLSENLRTNHHCSDSLYLYYHAAKAYASEEFNGYLNSLKERCPSAAAYLEHDVGFKKWSRAHFPGETILRENTTEGYKLYVNNINGSTDEFTVLGYDRSAKVNLSRWLCSCRKYDLIKLPCAHAMAVLRLKHGDEYDTSIYKYSFPIYSKESYLFAYLEPIYAVPLE
ncbi:hypothetical protein BC332_27498 [Capsicum chinense]|nr:hypothetical protein BC332_27498 [Capsicum chinense]